MKSTISLPLLLSVILALATFALTLMDHPVWAVATCIGALVCWGVEETE